MYAMPKDKHTVDQKLWKVLRTSQTHARPLMVEEAILIFVSVKLPHVKV